MSQFPIARQYSAPLAQLDRQTNQALVRSTNRITFIAELGRKVGEEMSVNYVTAERLVSESLRAAENYARSAPQNELSEGFFHAISQHYLQRMAVLTNLANDAMMRHAFGDDDY